MRTISLWSNGRTLTIMHVSTCTSNCFLSCVITPSQFLSTNIKINDQGRDRQSFDVPSHSLNCHTSLTIQTLTAYNNIHGIAHGI